MAGSYNYGAGTATTINVPSGMYVKTITCHTTTGGSFTIAGGETITLPAGVSFTEPFDASRELLVGPVAVVFTGTDSCFVSWGA